MGAGVRSHQYEMNLLDKSLISLLDIEGFKTLQSAVFSEKPSELEEQIIKWKIIQYV